MKTGFGVGLKCIAWTVVIVLVQACSVDGDGVAVLLKDHEYMPLSLGVYQVYDVTETEYINGPQGETQQYQLMMEVVDSIPYVNGYYQYIIHRKTRQNDADSWIPIDSWSATFTDREAVVQEGNVSFVKLVIPVSSNRAWNGNLYNTLGEEEYKINILQQPVMLGANSFADVLEVIQSNKTDNIVGNDVRKEIYARGVGLIYRSVEAIVYCSDEDICTPGSQQIESGVIMEQVIKEYGKK